jgi:nitrogen PTS system EIIA component
MPMTDFLKPDAVFSNVKMTSKKQLLQFMSEKAAEMTGIAERDIFDTIMQRERLGSTGVGNGIAIPHCKMASSARLTGLFVRLDQAIDFDSIDDQKVDLVFMLIAPELAGADHLKALSKVARALRSADIVDAIRRAPDSGMIYDILNPREASAAA